MAYFKCGSSKKKIKISKIESGGSINSLNEHFVLESSGYNTFLVESYTSTNSNNPGVELRGYTSDTEFEIILSLVPGVSNQSVDISSYDKIEIHFQYSTTGTMLLTNIEIS